MDRRQTMRLHCPLPNRGLEKEGTSSTLPLIDSSINSSRTSSSTMSSVRSSSTQLWFLPARHNIFYPKYSVNRMAKVWSDGKLLRSQCGRRSYGSQHKRRPMQPSASRRVFRSPHQLRETPPCGKETLALATTSSSIIRTSEGAHYHNKNYFFLLFSRFFPSLVMLRTD